MNKIFIISDIGINANGSFEKAQTLIDRAIYAGVDTIKFQHWTDEYESICPWKEKLQGQRFTNGDLYRLRDYTYKTAKNNNRQVEWFCTAFDFESLEIIKSLDVNIFKIPNNKIVKNNLELCNQIINSCIICNGRLIISTDYPDMGDFNNKLFCDIKGLDYKYNSIDISFLYCISKYPPKLEEIYLSDFKEFVQYKEENVLNIGISDHSSLIEIPIAAVAMGANVVEVHLTMNKNDIGLDHKASLEVHELKQMVDMIRNLEKCS